MTLQERFRLAWRLLWPLLVADVTWAILLYGIIGRQQSQLDSFYRLASVFVIAPLVVRHQLRRKHESFRFVVLRQGQAVDPSFGESFKVMWLLSWRTGVIGLVLLVPVSAVLRAVLSRPITDYLAFATASPFAAALALAAFDSLTSLPILPFVIPGMLSKHYKGFRVTVERAAR